MQINPTDLAPSILRLLENNRTAQAILHPPPIPPPAKPKLTFWRIVQGILILVGSGFTSLMIGGSLIKPIGENAAVLIMILLAFFSLLGTLYWVNNGLVAPVKHVKEESQKLSRALMETAFLNALSTGPSAVYGRALLLLMEIVEEKKMEEARAKQLLTQLNGLIEADATLAHEMEDVTRVIAPEAVAEWTEEQGQLRQRIEKTHDPLTQEALEQSLSMVEQRLQNADEMDKLAERLSARREAVSQTLESLESALTRMQVAAGEDTVDLDYLQHAVGNFNRESRSVEKAVDEVEALHLHH